MYIGFMYRNAVEASQSGGQTHTETQNNSYFVSDFVSSPSVFTFLNVVLGNNNATWNNHLRTVYQYIVHSNRIFQFWTTDLSLTTVKHGVVKHFCFVCH